MNQTVFNYRIVFFAVFLVFVIFVLWASLFKIDELVRGQGKIIPSGDIKKVQHLEGGIISQILAHAGQKVTKGQVLFRIRNEAAISNLNTLQVQLYAKTAEEARLRAELAGADNIQFPADVMEKVPNIIDNQKRLFFQIRSKHKDSIEVILQQVAQRRASLISTQNNIKNLAIQYKYSKEQEKILYNLVKAGAESRKNLINAKLEAQRLLTQFQQAQDQSKTDQKALNEAIAKVSEAKTEYIVRVQTNLSQVLIDLEKLKEQISVSVDKVLRTDVISPVDGLVKSLNFHTVGGIVGAAQVMAEVIPTNEDLIIQARVAPKDRGLIYIGQQANIRLTAYDPTIQGQIKGIITEISADTFTEPNTRFAYYLIKLKASKPDFGVNRPLYPGMVATVNIIAGHRTIMTYFFKPILKVLDSALIEP